MKSQTERIIKELSPHLLEWTRDFSDFIQWQHMGIIDPETSEFYLWDSMKDFSLYYSNTHWYKGIASCNDGNTPLPFDRRIQPFEALWGTVSLFLKAQSYLKIFLSISTLLDKVLFLLAKHQSNYLITRRVNP